MFGFNSFAVWEVEAKSSRSNRCDWREIKERSCLIKYKDHTLRLKGGKILVNNRVWRKIADIPYDGEKVIWDDVYVGSVARRVFLNLLVWDTPAGEASIQTLHWLVYEIKGGKAYMKLDREIQKRRWDQDSVKTIRDKRVRHELNYNSKTQKIQWKVGKESGEF